MHWCVAVRLFGLLGLAGAYAADIMNNQCNELKAQEHLDLNEVMGKWYVIEIIEHKITTNDGRPIPTTSDLILSTQRLVIDACPIVNLRTIQVRSGQSGPPRISLLWEEDAGNLEYTFWVLLSRGPGVWNLDIEQNGTLAEKSNYKQFVGTAFVMKAVASHMVLTFCSRSADGQKFTVLLAREHRLPKTDLRGIHKLLERRNLHLLSIRESCHNGVSTQYSMSFFIMSLFALITSNFTN